MIPKFISFLSLLFTISGFAQIPTNGLIAYYPFCGNANDASGNGLNGTVIGASLSSDRFGNSNSAYNFNGISNYISLPQASFIGLNVYSYSIWFKPTSNAVSLIFSVGSNDPYCQSLSFNTTSVSAGSYNAGSNPVQSYVFSNTLSGINNWIHVVVTRDNSSLKMYVNSILVAQNAASYTNNQAANYGSSPPYMAVLGTRSTLQSYFFQGLIDDVRIYATSLNQNDVSALYTETQAPALSVNSGSICSGSSFTFNPSGATSYSYSTGLPIVSPTITTSYTITGTSTSGCVMGSAVSTVTVIGSPVTTISGPTLGCTGKTATLIASGANSYHWSNTSTTSIITVTPTTSLTTYSVIGTSSTGCSGSGNFVLHAERCTGLHSSVYADYQIKIQSNPSSGNFVVQLGTDVSTNHQIIINDMEGKTLKIYTVEDGANSIEINSEFVAGCYILKLMRAENCVATKKIIITP